MMLHLSIMNGILAGVLALAAVYSIVAAWRTHLPWRRWRVGAMLACRLVLLGAVAAWCLELRVRYEKASDRVEMVVIADRSASISAEGRKTVEGWIERARGKEGVRVIEVGEEGTKARRHEGTKGTEDKGTREQGDKEVGEHRLAADATAQSAMALTPLAEAIDAARAALVGKGEKRILLLSDGRGTTRDPVETIDGLKSDRIRVFAVPVEPLQGESLIVELRVPASAWRQVPVPVEVTIFSADAQPCKLTLSVDGKLAEQKDLRLPRGTSSVELSATLATDGVHRIDVKAAFEQDHLEYNNSASALVDVPLAPRVIVVSAPPAAATAVASILSNCGFETRIVAPRELPASFACDCLVLSNVSAEMMTEPRLKAIERYVREGGSIVFTGGNKAFAAGGYVGSALEPVFPVMLMPKKEQPPYALAIVLDNSWSMNEGITSNIGKINLAKEIAIVAMQGLNKNDLLLLISFDSDYHTIIPPTKINELAPLEYEVARIGAFGMTNILGGMQEGAKMLQQMDAPYKHMILISDGKETEVGTDYSRLLALLARDKVTLTTIAVGLGPNEKLLNTLAFAGKGRYYHAKSISEIPATVLQESKNMENQLTVPVALPPRKLEDDPALAGIDVEQMPKLLGYNRSRARPHAWTPLVISSKNEPLMARMRYGRGQALAFMSSASGPWAKQWMEERKSDYIAFWRQAVISVLGPPSREIESHADFEKGEACFELAGGAVKVAPEGWKCELTRLAGDRQVSEPVSANLARLETSGCDALLLTAKGKSNWAFNWTRSFGRECDDPARGIETLKTLATRTGGVYAPKPDEAFAPGKSMIAVVIGPEWWLISAALLLIIELLVRRFPALKSLFAQRS